MTAPPPSAFNDMMDSDTTRPKPKKKRASLSTIVGVLLITMGLIGAGWIAWEYLGTNVVADREAEDHVAKLEQRWSDDGTDTEPTSEIPGDAFGLMRIPALGSDWEWPLVRGTDLSYLNGTIGWYDTTSQPGEIGNFAVAAHRVTHGEPFRRLLELKVGDAVVVETRSYIYTYEISTPPSELTVTDLDSWVLDPVPGQPEAKPTQELITLTTCQDFFRSADRSVGFGKLVDTQVKDDV